MTHILLLSFCTAFIALAYEAVSYINYLECCNDPAQSYAGWLFACGAPMWRVNALAFACVAAGLVAGIPGAVISRLGR